MSERITIGLKSLKMGDIEEDGGMGTTLAALGQTYENTAVLTQEDGDETDFYVEEVDDPVETISKKGATTLEWAILDMTPDTLKKVLGGDVTGTGEQAVWSGPTEVPEIEQSLELISKKNIKYEIPRARIKARLDVNFSKQEVGLVRITARVLTPTKTAEAPIKISKVVA